MPGTGPQCGGAGGGIGMSRIGVIVALGALLHARGDRDGLTGGTGAFDGTTGGGHEFSAVSASAVSPVIFNETITI
jgi:hypothetical protein